MLFSKEFINVARKICPLLLSGYKGVKIKSAFVPSRSFIFKGQTKNPEDVNRSKDDILSTPFAGFDDPTFTDRILKRMQDPMLIKTGTNHIIQEFKKLYKEKITEIKNFGNHRIDSKINRVEMLFIFETEEDIKKFTVNTDSSFLMGYSSASLKLTQEKTALFSGNICTDVPRDGNVKVSGFANIISLKQRGAFYRLKYFDWTQYTHLVFKIRGDGHNYLIIFTTPGEYLETKDLSYAHPLYTRGGPYWQIAKIPLSHFYFSRKGHISMRQSGHKFLNKIQKLGITVGCFDGPFKLEIDYIGLECDPFHKDISPYEEYY